MTHLSMWMQTHGEELRSAERIPSAWCQVFTREVKVQNWESMRVSSNFKQRGAQASWLVSMTCVASAALMRFSHCIWNTEVCNICSQTWTNSEESCWEIEKWWRPISSLPHLCMISRKNCCAARFMGVCLEASKNLMMSWLWNPHIAGS